MIVLLLIYALIAALNVPKLIKKKEWRELSVFLFFYSAGFALGLMYVLDIPVPSPMKGLDYLVVDLLGIKYPE